jgi:predicted ArsR family transcriptional regulator
VLKSGRPRLDDSPGFRERFATILPRLIAGEISQGQAARELGISVRSLKRYVKQAQARGAYQERRVGVGRHPAF